MCLSCQTETKLEQSMTSRRLKRFDIQNMATMQFCCLAMNMMPWNIIVFQSNQPTIIKRQAQMDLLFLLLLSIATKPYIMTYRSWHTKCGWHSDKVRVLYMLCNEKTNRFGSFFVHLVEKYKQYSNSAPGECVNNIWTLIIPSIFYTHSHTRVKLVNTNLHTCKLVCICFMPASINYM